MKLYRGKIAYDEQPIETSASGSKNGNWSTRERYNAYMRRYMRDYMRKKRMREAAE